MSELQNDLEIATCYLFLNMAIKNLELDLQHIQNSAFKIKDPYINLIENMISKAIIERRELKRMMYQRKIKVVFMYRQGNYSSYKFIVDEQEYQKTYISHIMKKNVKEIIKKLMR